MASDTMVLLDDSLFAQGFTFVNRNRLKCPDGELWITVPIRRTTGKRQKIKDLKIHEKQYWVKKWMKTLYHSYLKSLWFNEIQGELKRILEAHGDCFLDMVFSVLEFIKFELGIATPFTLQSDTGIKSSGFQLLMDMVEELNADEVILIRVSFLHYFSPVYPQFWGQYKKNLSALDLLFCMGKESRRVLEKGYKLITS
jgi:hypothetical protein